MKISNAAALGKGSFHPTGSVDDASLMASLSTYRRRIAGMYRSVKPGEIASGVFGAPFHVSPKVDGELWFLVLHEGEAVLVTANGKAISGDVPVLAEVRASAKAIKGRAVIAGELFAASSGKGRPRVGDVAASLAGGAQAPVERLGFLAFDLVEGVLADAPLSCSYSQRLDAISELFASGKRAKSVRTDLIDAAGGLPTLFAELVEGGKAEGLVVRSAQGTIYKIKPEFTIDAVIIGFTRRTEDPGAVRSLLMGLTREDGRTQIAGFCGNLGSDDERRKLLSRLSALSCSSTFRCPSSSGELYTFVRPEVVAEINVTDLQTESSDGRAIRSMVLDHDADAGWQAVGQMPTASWLHPVLVRLRDDKSPGPVDTRFAQVLERCSVGDASAATNEQHLPASEILTRRVWTKTTKGKVAVRKLLMWKTNKSGIDPDFPAYVVHWTDYSAGRGTPLEREVRTAPTAELAETIAAKLIEENVKKGWEERS
jgi:hypothetical protein